MELPLPRRWLFASLMMVLAGAAALWAIAQHATGDRLQPLFQAATSLSTLELMSPAELAAIIQAPKGEKPLVLNVGPHLLYLQAHISGAEYIGQGSEPQALQAMRSRVKGLPKNKFIVIYCGCCPWTHCPNIAPAYQELKKLGFTKVKALYMPNNLGADWVYKGYPTVRGQ